MLLVLRRNKQLNLAVVALFAVPVLFNIVALCNEVGAKILLQTFTGTYECFSGFVCNPLPEILLKLIGTSLILTALALLVILVANLSVIRRLPTAFQFTLRFVLILPSSVVFSNVCGVFMPLSWLPVFNDYLLGLPTSTFAVIGSWIFVFPATLAVMFIAIRLIEKELEQFAENVVSLPAGAG